LYQAGSVVIYAGIKAGIYSLQTQPMKKFIIAFALMATSYSQLCAQEVEEGEMPMGSTEINLSYGYITTDQILDFSKNLFVSVASLGELQLNATDYTGGIFLTARRRFTGDRFAAGLALGIDNIKGDMKNSAGVKKGTYKFNVFTISAEGVIHYISKPKFKFYGLLGAGYSFFSTKYDVPGEILNDNIKGGHFNFQFSPIGLKFGDRFGGFLELGLGYKGLGNIGLFARF
jgi:hypothetical protein